MGINDDEDPRILVEFTILPPAEEKKEEPAPLKSAAPKRAAPAPAAPAKPAPAEKPKKDSAQPRYM